MHMPADAPHGMAYFWGRRYVAFPILGLAAAAGLHAPDLASRRHGNRALGAAADRCRRALLGWPRSRSKRCMDSAQHPAALTALLASRPGEVLWVDGLTEAWYLAGRPQWASPQQGVSSIFSAELGAANITAACAFSSTKGSPTKIRCQPSRFRRPPICRG